ncbi:hypothetical protein F2P44_11750 [Massilia sp. CCM 8695]|uniref:DUF2059 domain-containing protein n=1 Tax=Massilia frigida TaxID=2609281 RepID=A0ABX0NGU9_9BURK|nr:hypothetical protein [Massilia frigida]NHZ79945.1 hypothetical protein [Massilia frigida]
MHTPFINAARALAQACIVLLALAHGAHAAPATEETLRRYFEMANSARMVVAATDAMLEIEAREWQGESDPKEKAKLKARFERTSAFVRQQVAWDKIEPVAIESYQKHLQESDVQELIAQAHSPLGQTIINKVTPALLKQPPVVAAYMAKRIEEIRERKDGSVPSPVVPPQPPAGSKEAQALAMMLGWPRARDDFDKNMADIETRGLEMAAAFNDEATAGIGEELRRFSKAIRNEIKFEEIAAIEARMIAGELSEAEIAALSEEHNNPARVAQRIRIGLADAELMARMSAAVQSSDAFKQLANADSDDAPRKAARAGKAAAKK